MNKLLLPSLLLSLAGCTVGPNYQAPDITASDDWFASETAQNSATTLAINTQWWQQFNDPLLNHYIDQAASNNKDLAIALANVRAARAARMEQRGSFKPSVNGDLTTERFQSSTSSTFNNGVVRNNFDTGFDASWEIDIFGGNRRAVEAATAREQASSAQYHDVMLSTLSEVARTYYEARGLQKRIAMTEQNIQLLKATTKVIQDRLSIGETSEFDLTRAESEYELTYARLPNLIAERHAAIFRLSVLLGLPPEALLEEMNQIQPLPSPPDIVPVGLRSDILRRRPDIRAAERELAASVADIGAEKGDLFPKFFLTGDIGSQAQRFGDLFASGTGFWTFGSALQWSVFEGGAIRARVAQEQAERDAALALYEKTVLEALRDTETALSRYGEEIETTKRLARGVQSLKRSATLAKALYNAGEQDYLAYIDAERQRIASEDDLVVSETAAITKLITLYTALGGGWDSTQ